MGWLLVEVIIYRYELIGYYVLIILFGLLMLIGFTELAEVIKPTRLSDYILTVLRRIRDKWCFNVPIKSIPIANPEKQADKPEKTSHPFPLRKTSPINTPNVECNGGSTNKQNNPDKPVKGSIHPTPNLPQVKEGNQPNTNKTLF